jgi:hypothetical protein
MSNRSRIVLGSLGGAFAIHLAALACSGNGGIVGGRDASTADADQVAAHDGGVLDVLASALDAVGDAVRDVATKVVDGEVRDAHAGGDSPRTMEAACNVPGGGVYSSFRYATFSVPGLNPRTAGEIHARVCGYTCTVDSGTCPTSYMPAGTDCQDTIVTSGTGSVTVFCGAEGWVGTTARIWLH